MIEITDWVRDQVPADVDLDRQAMAQLSLRIVGRGVAVAARTSATTTQTRFYRQLYRDPNLDIWLICWIDGQSTGYHDHDRSSGAVCVCEGTLYEDWFRVEEDGWVRERTTVHDRGRRVRLRRGRHPRRAPSGTRCRPCDVDPSLLTGALAHGPLRARPARHAAHRDHVRRRAARRRVGGDRGSTRRPTQLRLHAGVPDAMLVHG